MKSLLLYANKDAGTDERLDAALVIAAAFDSHIRCLQVTPFQGYMLTDPFGGAYPAFDLLAAIQTGEEEVRARMEARLQRAGACWDWSNATGDPQGTAIDRMNLADLAIVSLAPEGEDGRRSPPAARLATGTTTPVLAIAHGGVRFDVGGKAMVAWNGSPEASHALCRAVPFLHKAAEVHIVTASEDQESLPSLAAAEYLGYHGIKAELRREPVGDGAAAAILRAADELEASYIVMGAYGHSRFRETMFGGVTRALCASSRYSLFLAH